MYQSSEHKARPQHGRALAIGAALLCATALGQPNLAYAGAHGGGGGFHGGGGFGGFHGGGFHGGGFGGFHGGGFHGGAFHGDRFHGNRFFFGGSFTYPLWDYYPDYGYYGYSQPYYSQTWYYCSDPAGYYPYVTQCNNGWQTVPAS